MNLTLRSVTISDKHSKYHNKKVDIRIENGQITKIGRIGDTKGKQIKGQDLIASPGWFDMNCLFGDPGFEHKEDRFSGAQSCASGGFTGIAHLPNTSPVVASKNDIAYLVANNSKQVTDIHPVAAVTKDAKGEDLTEMIDLYHAGAIAFSDGVEPIWNSDILLKTLQYLQKFGGLLINRPEDKMLTQFGTMNEGVTSTIQGMKGMPSLAEELMISRDLDILAYTGGKIHFSNISTAESVNLIKQAKKKGLKVTCDVALHQLLLDDSLINDFDTNLKVNPPLRGKKDIDALIKGIEDDTVDAITSSHRPHDEECKKLEFDLADFGHIGVQTVLPGIVELKERLSLDTLIEKITHGPRQILGLESATIKENETANLTVFSPFQKWTYDDATNFSKSKNSYYYNKELTGRVVATINGKNSYIL